MAMEHWRKNKDRETEVSEEKPVPVPLPTRTALESKPDVRNKHLVVHSLVGFMSRFSVYGRTTTVVISCKLCCKIQFLPKTNTHTHTHTHTHTSLLQMLEEQHSTACSTEIIT